MKNKNSDTSLVRKVTVYGMMVNLLLGAAKVFTGIIGSSHATIADGIHSFSDLSTDIAILIGVKFWSAPPDKDHPYGHARIETIVTFIIGSILFLAGLGIGYEAVTSIRDESIDRPGWIALTGIILSIILKEFMYRWTLSVGRKAKSPSVIANAWHHRSDAFSSVLAFMSVTAAVFLPGMEFIDLIGAIAVSFIIIKVAWDIIKPTLSELTDKGLCQEDIDNIVKTVSSVSGVKEVHRVRSRSHNVGIYIDLHVLVDGNLSVAKGHDIAEEVKSILIKEGPSIVDVVVHIEPFNAEQSINSSF